MRTGGRTFQALEGGSSRDEGPKEKHMVSLGVQVVE